MKISMKIIPVLIILINALAFIGCSDLEDAPPVTYTVTFSSQFLNTESATVMPNPTSITVEEGQTVGTLPTAPSMSGYKFGGWWTGKDGNGVLFTATTVVNSDMIVYAYWYNYQVMFMNDGETYAGRGVRLPAKTLSSLPACPTKDGYTFAGWYTAANGSGTEFTISTEVTADITVYAYWTNKTVYMVNFNSDGGSAAGIRYIVLPDTTVGTTPTPTKTFYTFNNWYTAVNGGGTVFTGSTPVTGNITVYANWISDAGYTVEYNSYGGISLENQHVILSKGNTVATGTDEGDTPEPTKRCFKFLGWYTEPDGEGTEFTKDTVITGDNTVGGKITVYAKWDWNYPSSEYPLITSPFAIGDYGPSCVGKVFYVTDGGSHGLEAAPPNWYDGSEDASSVAWINGDPTTDEEDDIYQKTQTTLNGKTSTAIGTGLANSNAIVAQVEQAGGTDIPYAAQLCLDYSVGAGEYLFNDWFLPSRDELAQLYVNRDVKSSGGFLDEGYWSSSEYGQWDGWSQYFSDGRQTGTYKSQGRLIRPVRKF